MLSPTAFIPIILPAFPHCSPLFITPEQPSNVLLWPWHALHLSDRSQRHNVTLIMLFDPCPDFTSCPGHEKTLQLSQVFPKNKVKVSTAFLNSTTTPAFYILLLFPFNLLSTYTFKFLTNLTWPSNVPKQYMLVYFKVNLPQKYFMMY